MKPNDRARLTAALRDHVAKIADNLRVKMRAPGEARIRAQQLHADERVSEDFEVWTDLLSRRAAVLWVLKSVYVRVLEDRGLLAPGRLLDAATQHLFERLAPHLGETAFLRWIYRDLASKRGGLPELFGLQPAEIALPSDELSRALIAFWRHHDADTAAIWSFAEERFEGELMGDLYQDLDPVVKDRFALCQTPDFVRAFILDRTLTPAIETFGAAEVRLLDPACGSGHFLIDGLKRLVTAMAVDHAQWGRRKVVAHALDRIVGIDLNDYACALARTRLLMTAAELAGVANLADAACFHPHVYWADGLEQVEREEQKPSLQFGLFEKVEEQPRATLAPSDVRAALKRVLVTKFHAVVANPPFIVESDDARKKYHRERVGKQQRYVSAYRQYSLASPFTERCFQLTEKEGFVGLITSNNFMKREFGKPLIEKVLAGLDLALLADTSQAYIPFHGTPTVLLFGRNRRPTSETVRAVMGKRGETGTPADPHKGRVWLSIVEGWNEVGFQNEYVSVADVPRATLSKYPWSLGGGGAAELKSRLEEMAATRLSTHVELPIGRAARIAMEAVFLCDGALGVNRRGFALAHMIEHFRGEGVRDWGARSRELVWFPYLLPSGQRAVDVDDPAWSKDLSVLWPYRVVLASRATFQGVMCDAGLEWFEYMQFTRSLVQSPMQLTFANVATHNHFAFVRGRHVFNSKAPVIKLPADATERDHLALLGLLNSSTACFWMKQVFHCKGSQGVNEGTKSTQWEQFFEFDATKIKLLPVVADYNKAAPYAARLDALARSRSARSVRSVLDNEGWNDALALRLALNERRNADVAELALMVALQEELDWLCYALYGLDDASDVVPPENVEPCLPMWLPWCLAFADRDSNNRAVLARGETPDEQPTTWFTRHRWEPLAALPEDASPALRARIESRRARTATIPALAFTETPQFKRRWYKPDYGAEELETLEQWLADRLEKAAMVRASAFTLEQLVASLQDDPRVLAVCEVITGRKDFSLFQLSLEALRYAVPSHRFHLYTPAGLVKRGVWERTWADQRREDAGERIKPEPPPPYGSSDFLKPEYWKVRGKLDIPKERFIAFTEVPGRVGMDTIFGWAGWGPTQRLKAILGIDEELEDAAVPLADRIGLLDSAWRLLSEVAREEPTIGGRLKAELQALVGPEGPSRELIEDWKKNFPAPTTRTRRAAAACKEDDGSGNEESGES